MLPGVAAPRLPAAAPGAGLLLAPALPPAAGPSLGLGRPLDTGSSLAPGPPLVAGPLAAPEAGLLLTAALPPAARPSLGLGWPLDTGSSLAAGPLLAPGAGLLLAPARPLGTGSSLAPGRSLAAAPLEAPGRPLDIGPSACVKSSLRLPRLSGVARLSCNSGVHADCFASASGVLVAVARDACAFPASDEDCEDSACNAAADIDAVGVETFSKSNVSVSLSAASNSSMTSRIVRGRRLGSFANMCITRAPSSGGICRVGTRGGTRSSIARFLSKWG